MMGNVTLLTYPERLQTFEVHWIDNLTTARQLAAIGHVCDRPPLEAREEGSRCISCGAFVQKDLSIKALEGSPTSSTKYEDSSTSFNFHHPGCTRLQVRVPLEPQAIFPGLHGSRIDDLRRRFERRPLSRDVQAQTQRASQSSSLFSLPTEIRLEIYSMILPSLDADTKILQLNSDSPRVVSSVVFEKAGPRDTTKANLLRTCRAVNEEAIDLLYSKTTFKFSNTKVMYLFLRSIGHAGRQQIKSVEIMCGGREDAIAFALLASCEKLRAICIRLPRAVLFFPRAPIWIIDGATCLLALKGLKEVTFGSCASSIHSMSDEKPDAAIIREALTKPRGSPVTITWTGGHYNV